MVTGTATVPKLGRSLWSTQPTASAAGLFTMWTGWRRPLSSRQLWTCLKLNSRENNIMRLSQTRRILTSARKCGEGPESQVQSVDDKGKDMTHRPAVDVSDDQLAQMVNSLSSEQRLVVLDQLHLIQAAEAKKKAEGWLQRFETLIYHLISVIYSF